MQTPIESWDGAPATRWIADWGVPALHLFRRATSTNDVARRLAEAGSPAGTVVIAEEQTAGRGRGGRTWHATPGKALLLSMVFRPAPAGGRDAEVTALPLRVGLATALAVEDAAGIATGIKWPNDVVAAGGRKLAGILCEAAARGGSPVVIAGIGLNVDQLPEDWPPGIAGSATSLRITAGSPQRRSAVAGALIRRLLRFATAPAAALEPSELAALESRDVLRDHPIHLDGRPAGTAAGIAEDGSLVIRSEHGTPFHIRNGTVRLSEAPP